MSVVIPVKNEAANLPYVFNTIPDWISQVVLVDGRSTDNTAEIALRLRPGVKVITQTGTGKGDAPLDHVLAKGWAVVRRTRAIVTGVPIGA